MLRKANSNITKQALEWNPKDNESVVHRPKNIWRRGLVRFEAKSGEKQRPSHKTDGDGRPL